MNNTDMPEYRVWKSMIRRCHAERDPDYADYGGRGVSVAEEWRGSGGFSRFIAHLGRRPTDRHQVDRINNDGNYEPGNCRWVTQAANMRHTRRTRWVEAFGERASISDWSDRSGMPVYVIRERLKCGWPPERAVTEAVDSSHSHAATTDAMKARIVELLALGMTQRAVARECGVSQKSVYRTALSNSPRQLGATPTTRSDPCE